MSRIALYPGSFDPVTNGHLDVVRQAVQLCDQLIVAVGVHSSKTPLFSTEERLAMTREAFGAVAAQAGCGFDATTYDNLTVAAAQEAGAIMMIRGLRDGTDLERDAARRHEPGHGASHPDRLRAGLGPGPPDHRHTGPSNRCHGRRCIVVRAPVGCGRPQGQVPLTSRAASDVVCRRRSEVSISRSLPEFS